MPVQESIQIITLTAGGGTESLPTNSLSTLYVIQGAATLTSNWTIQPTGAVFAGLMYNFKYEAEIDLNGNTITIFGKTLPTTLADKTHEITAYYDGVDWEVNFKVDVSEPRSIPNSAVEMRDISFKGVTPSHTMDNGLPSPTIVANPNLTTDLLVRALEGNNTLEVIGSFSVTNIDETVGAISYAVYPILDTTFLPSTPKYYTGIAKITDGSDYRQTPIRLFTGDQSTAFHRRLWLQIDKDIWGSEMNATYEVYVNLHLRY